MSFAVNPPLTSFSKIIEFNVKMFLVFCLYFVSFPISSSLVNFLVVLLLERCYATKSFCFADWGPNIDVVGFCFLDLASNYQPANSLVEWLEAGKEPIYIGFGSLVSFFTPFCFWNCVCSCYIGEKRHWWIYLAI